MPPGQPLAIVVLSEGEERLAEISPAARCPAQRNCAFRVRMKRSVQPRPPGSRMNDGLLSVQSAIASAPHGVSGPSGMMVPSCALGPCN
jgi:hypothetical protein